MRAVGKADDLGHGFRGVLDIDYINTLAFRLTFASTFSQAVTSEVHQTGFVTKNFDAYSFNIYTERYQNFLSSQQTPGNSVIIRQIRHEIRIRGPMIAHRFACLLLISKSRRRVEDDQRGAYDRRQDRQ